MMISMARLRLECLKACGAAAEHVCLCYDCCKCEQGLMSRQIKWFPWNIFDGQLLKWLCNGLWMRWEYANVTVFLWLWIVRGCNLMTSIQKPNSIRCCRLKPTLMPWQMLSSKPGIVPTRIWRGSSWWRESRWPGEQWTGRGRFHHRQWQWRIPAETWCHQDHELRESWLRWRWRCRLGRSTWWGWPSSWWRHRSRQRNQWRAWLSFQQNQEPCQRSDRRK